MAPKKTVGSGAPTPATKVAKKVAPKRLPGQK